MRSNLHSQQTAGDGVEAWRLPFVITVLADVGGDDHVPLSERHTWTLRPEGIDGALAALSPRLSLRVENRPFDDGGDFQVDLTFRSLADFEPERLVGQVPRLVALLAAGADVLATRLLDAILHHEEFQRLEGTWRSLQRMVEVAPSCRQLQFRVLPVTRRELQAEATAPTSGDHLLWRSLGGEPTAPDGLLVVDFSFGKSPADVALLRSLAKVAAALHAPMLTAAAPDLLGVRDWVELAKVHRVTRRFDESDPENAEWLAFRDLPEARFVVLVLPRCLVRPPHGSGPRSSPRFHYVESVGSTSDYLWGNLAYVLAARIGAAFARAGPCSHFVGFEGGGRVDGLPVHSRPDGAEGSGPLEVEISEMLEADLIGNGLNAPLRYAGLPRVCFFGATSARRLAPLVDRVAIATDRLLAELPYLLAFSHFVHHLQAIASALVADARPTAERGAEVMARWLQGQIWDERGSRPRPVYWVREAQVEIEPMPGCPGRNRAHLSVCFQDVKVPVRATFDLGC